MQSSIALDKESQSSFTKAVKNIKKSIKKGVVKVSEEAVVDSKRRVSGTQLKRGVVYLSHIPYGFMEDGLNEYFSQFGQVTAVKLARSKKTGKSRGFAFIEFLHPEVAEVAAKTMNNYLMMNRLIKALYIPPEKQKKNMFLRKNSFVPITPLTCKGAKNREKHIAKKNAETALESDVKANRNTKKTLQGLKRKLSALDVQFNFQPVNDPTDDEVEDADSDDDEVSCDEENQVLPTGRTKGIASTSGRFVLAPESDDDDDDQVFELTSKKTDEPIPTASVKPNSKKRQTSKIQKLKQSLVSSVAYEELIGSSDSEIEFNPNAGSVALGKANGNPALKRKNTPKPGSNAVLKPRKIRGPLSAPVKKTRKF